MQHSFDVDVAKEYGIFEAVLLNHLYFWIEKNRANGRHEHDGRTWTYNSVKAFNSLFPYASAGQIRRALKKLEENGLIITGNFNASAYDRTTWYAFTEKGNSIFQKQYSHLSNLTNGSVENSEPIPDINQMQNTNKKPDKPPRAAVKPTLEELKTRLGAVAGSALFGWFRYRWEDLKKPFKTRRAVDKIIEETAERLKDYSADDVAALLAFCEAREWQSIYWEHIGQASGKPAARPAQRMQPEFMRYSKEEQREIYAAAVVDFDDED